MVFDIGYSGRILSAIQKALQYPVIYAYLHEDHKDFQTNRRRDNLNVEIMYDFVPPFSDLIREYFMSEVGNSCINFTEQNGIVEPVYKDTEIVYDERIVPDMIKNGAYQFILDFSETFMPIKDLIDFNPVCVSMPFEGLIQSSLSRDRDVLQFAYSDDTVYGRNDHISMADFWKTQSDISMERGGIIGINSYLHTQLYKKTSLEKALFYWICD